MMVIVSDWHLSDGTSGTYLSPALIEGFVRDIREAIRRDGISRLILVLNGDTIDLLRSLKWHEAAESDVHPPRPWGDGIIRGTAQYAKVEKLLHSILDGIEKTYGGVLQELRALPDALTGPNKEFKVVYIAGNHEWVANVFPSVARRIAHLFKVDPQWFRNDEFPYSIDFSSTHFTGFIYPVFVRHGHCYDAFNTTGIPEKNIPSVGNVFDIEVICGLLWNIRKLMGESAKTAAADMFLKALQDADHVRPEPDASAYINWILSWPSLDPIRKQVEKATRIALNRARKAFNAAPVVSSIDWWIWPPSLDKVRVFLWMSHINLDWASRLGKKLDWGIDWTKCAASEKVAREGHVNYIVYGHTHRHDVCHVANKRGDIVLYFNTGTWRKVFFRVPNHSAFTSQCTLTHLYFFDEQEQKLPGLQNLAYRMINSNMQETKII